MKPDRFCADPNQSEAARIYKHWLRTFTNFIDSLPAEPAPNKFNLLINYVVPNVYDYISECTHFEIALQTLETIYIKPKNEIFAQHLLATCKQQPGETLEQFIVELKTLAKDCNFVNVTVEQYRSESICVAFINGISSNNTRQRLLENKTLDLNTVFDQARSLDVAQQSSNVCTGVLG